MEIHRALVPLVSFSSGKVSRCAVIRDDHLRCYYLDNARCTAAWKYIRLVARTMNYAQSISFLSLHPSPPLSLFLLLLLQPVRRRKNDLWPPLYSGGPFVGSSSIWTVIHKSQTCILVHANQWDNQNRHELRDSSTSRRNNPYEDIINFNLELILHYCDLRVSLYAFPVADLISEVFNFNYH